MKNFSKIVDNFDVTTKKYVDDGLAEKANSSDLATVATSGSYNDLSDKPTIPDVSGKLDKTGGTITGNLAVDGNLTINGTTTTVDSTTLQVKDKLIEVAHGNTAALTTPAGLVAPKYDGTNSGALVFDSTGTAYVGDITLKDGNIDVTNSQLQPLATRTGLVGGNLVQYDSTALTLKDSGKKIGDLALKTDISGKLSKTENTGVNVLGTTKSTTTLGGNQLVAPNGIIFAGTAANAGLVTRGICGVSTPDNKGACSKENLYINYDGNNDFNAGRQVVLNAGAVGNHLGSNMYQYAVPRGDIVKAWVEAQGYAKTTQIPTVNNGTLTIQQNGQTVGTFTANQKDGTTANITVPTKASDVNALSLDGGTIKKSKTIKMDASANSDGANLKWGTVNSKNPYIGYASDQVDGTFVVGSLLGTNYASGLAIGGGSGNLLWKGTKVATTSDIPTKVSELTNDSGYTTNKGTVTQVKINGTTKSPDSAGLVDLGTVGGGSSDNSKHGYTQLTNENLNTITEAGWYRAASENTCTNRPRWLTSTNPFVLEVEKSTDAYIKQTAYQTGNSVDTDSVTYVRYSSNSGSSWTDWVKNQKLVDEYTQTISGYKMFIGGINLMYSALDFNGSSGSSGQFAMSQGSSSPPKWVNLKVKVNGTTYTADSSGLIDLGTISGGGSASTSQYNDIY